MSAEQFSIVKRPASSFSTEKKKGGKSKLAAAQVSALTALTTNNTVSDALDILSNVVAKRNTVEPNRIGLASSVEN